MVLNRSHVKVVAHALDNCLKGFREAGILMLEMLAPIHHPTLGGFNKINQFKNSTRLEQCSLARDLRIVKSPLAPKKLLRCSGPIIAPGRPRSAFRPL
eukprot:1304352-Amorphochlora_amoeboformis.AAC.1